MNENGDFLWPSMYNNKQEGATDILEVPQKLEKLIAAYRCCHLCIRWLLFRETTGQVDTLCILFQQQHKILWSRHGIHDQMEPTVVLPGILNSTMNKKKRYSIFLYHYKQLEMSVNKIAL